MGRILAIDVGLKRTGLAVTDPLKMFGSPLETVPAAEALSFIKRYCESEEVEAFVIGIPVNLNGQPTDATAAAKAFAENLKTAFPEKPVHEADERFTSKMAQQTLIKGGMKKKNRQQKGNLDKVSAAIILQSFLERQNL